MLKDRESVSPPCGAGGGSGGGANTAGAGEGGAVCSGCGGRIADRYYLLAVDRQWHSSCLRCFECRAPLATEQTCFSRDGHIFCKEDYYRLFAVKRCARCQTAISSSELVMRARDLVFHLHCFTCATCGAALARGDHFGIRERLAYCRPHFEQLLACCEHLDSPFYGADSPSTAATALMITAGVQKGRPRKRKLAPVSVAGDAVSPLGAELAQHPLAMRLSDMVSKGDLGPGIESVGYDGGVLPQELSSSMESLSYECGPGSPGSLSAQGQPRTKRMRTSFKHHQLRTMKSYFAINQNPDAKDLKQLAQKTGLSKRVLQVWFQNARAKWRRNMMRQENGQQAGAPGPGSGSAAPGGVAPSGGPTLAMQEASLEELHHHHAHHLSHSTSGAAALALAELY